jgi:hypothetical protein
MDRCVRSFWSLAVIKCQDEKFKKFSWIIWSIKLWGAIISESLTNVTVLGVPLSSQNVATEWKLSLIYWISFPKSFGPKFILYIFIKLASKIIQKNNLVLKLTSYLFKSEPPSPNVVPSSFQCVPQDTLNSTTRLSRMLCPKLCSFHVYRWCNLKETFNLPIETSILGIKMAHY